MISLSYIFQMNSGEFNFEVPCGSIQIKLNTRKYFKMVNGQADEDDCLVSIIRISNSNGWENKDERDNQGFQIQI